MRVISSYSGVGKIRLGIILDYMIQLEINSPGTR